MKILLIALVGFIVFGWIYVTLTMTKDCGLIPGKSRCFCQDGLILWKKCFGDRVDIPEENP